MSGGSDTVTMDETRLRNEQRRAWYAARPELCYLSVGVAGERWTTMLKIKHTSANVRLCSECAH